MWAGKVNGEAEGTGYFDILCAGPLLGPVHGHQDGVQTHART